jgi:2-polyprenyl-6-methoxyphenol hydroxylase-like FAD-dependent oxidoreductase
MGQVIIVGAGPAGAATAWILVQRGIPVTLIEQDEHFDRRFRGEGLMPAGVEALEQLGLQGCLARIPARSLDAWDFYIDRQRRMRVPEALDPWGDRPTQIISQGDLLQLIVQEAGRHPTFTFLQGWQARNLIRDETGISGVKISKGTETRDLTATVTIAADGRYSRLRNLAGLSLDKSPTQFDVLWFKLPAPPEQQTETVFSVCLQPDRQFAFYPSWDQQLQWGWIVPKGQAKTMTQIDWIDAFAQAVPESLAVPLRQQRQALAGPMFLDVIVGYCPQWSIPGLVFIGDAAHPMAPNRAQGINMALRDAIVLANHLVPVLQAEAPRPELTAACQAIQAEREPEIKAVQHLQLEEWQRLALITQNPLTYLPFKTLATVLGRWRLTHLAWLRQQRALRHGVVPVQLRV